MATLVVRYGWGRKVFEVDAEGGATLGVAKSYIEGNRHEEDDKITTVHEKVIAVFFEDAMISRPYKLGELDDIGLEEAAWCQFLHDREGMRSMTLNGETIWSCEPSAADKINDALDALEELRP